MPGTEPFSSARLRRDFGLDGLMGASTLSALYHAAKDSLPFHNCSENWYLPGGRAEGKGAKITARQDKALELIARKLPLPGKEFIPGLLVFALHSYYALLVKLLAAPLLNHPFPEADGVNLREWLTAVEEEPFFGLVGGEGIGEPTAAWYLQVWTVQLEQALEKVVTVLREYRSPGMVDPGDLLQDLYQSLLPPALRHGLGEYYTPQWLVEYLFEVLAPAPCQGLNGGGWVLDPACGSGAFLLQAIKRLRKEQSSLSLSPKGFLHLIGEKIMGVDKNPLAVLAARVNCLFSLADLVAAQEDSFVPPIYLGDTLMAPPTTLTGKEFDYIVGNPPWINWENLDSCYREETRRLWSQYGLFTHQGFDALLGKSKDDLAVLVTYVAVDLYLKKGGTLGFLVPQSLFKTTGAGRGFRSLLLQGSCPLEVLRVEDLSEMNPFPGAKNRTALILLRKGRPTTYPVPYFFWKRTEKGASPSGDEKLQQVIQSTRRLSLVAEPVDERDRASPWISSFPEGMGLLQKVTGPAAYKAREGVNTGGANGIFYLQINGVKGEEVWGENLTAGTKRWVPQVEGTLEGDLVYPLLRGRDIRPWVARTRAHILLTHREGEGLRAIPEEEMAEKYPRCFAYLSQFSSLLKERRTRVVRNLMDKGPVYSMFGVGDYTFAPFKVVWLRIGRSIRAAVVGKEKSNLPIQETVIPNDSIVFVPFFREEEAHFFCALLNSPPAKFVVRTTSVLATGSFASPHILKKIAIPAFDPGDIRHQNLAYLAGEAARIASGGEATEEIEAEIDGMACQLWGLSFQEMGEIKKYLQLLDG